MAPRFPKYWKGHPDRKLFVRTGGVACIDPRTGDYCKDRNNDDDTPPPPPDTPYQAFINLYQPKHLRRRSSRGYDLHWKLTGTHGSTNNASTARAVEEGFVTRYSKGGRYYIKLWYDENQDGIFKKRDDSWFAKFDLGRLNSADTQSFKNSSGRKFINQTDDIVSLDFRFPNREYLSSLGEDQDKYIFARNEDDQALLFKTVRRWAGYKHVGIEEATFWWEKSTRDGWGRDIESKAEISESFSAKGTKSRRDLIDDLTEYPSKVTSRQIDIRMINLGFDDYRNNDRFVNVKAVFTGSPRKRPRNAFLEEPTFHFVLEQGGEFSLYLSRSDNGVLFDPADILIASGKTWFSNTQDFIERSIEDNNGASMLHMKIDAVSTLSEKKWWNQLLKTSSKREIKANERRDSLKEFGFYHDIISDRMSNLDDRLGFSNLRMATHKIDYSSVGDLQDESLVYTHPSYIPESPW